MSTTAEDVLAACGNTSCPVAIDPSAVVVKVVPRWLRNVLNPAFTAITAPWAIYVRPEALGQLDTRRLIVHELAHMEQWQRLGLVRFLQIYLGEYIAARRSGASHMSAYYGISLEFEARAIAEQT